ncbi:LPS kinase [Actinomycetes bacterium]|nr:LPS kinase [Actinomycetes bacterium]
MAATDKQLHIKGLGEEISALYNLPWHTPLEQWPEDETLAAQRGISRHIVRLVRSTPDPASEIYAVKETVEEFAVREYEALRELSLRGAPAVAQVAIVTNRYSQNGEELPCAIVTRFLPYSLPYRVILSGQITQHEITNMANALAYLLVRLHLLGFWWGDCSLSNTLFRRDAEGFAAYLVDAETGEFQKKLSDGQREHDLELARFNVAAELEDLKIAGVLFPAMDPIRGSESVITRYRKIWKSLSEPQILPAGDRHAVERAMRSLQDIGFAVEEVDIQLAGDKSTVTFIPKLVAPNYHSQRLIELMGLETEELQAKRILASFDRFRSREIEKTPKKEEAAKRWLDEVFYKVINAVPTAMRGRVEDAQLFHEVLEHRWYLGEKAGRDLGLEFATNDYISKVLPERMDSGAPTL